MNRIDAYQIEDNHQFKKLDFKVSRKKSRVFTRDQALAEEVYLFLSKSLAFSRIMSLIKRKGYEFIFRCYNEVRKSESVKNPPALFHHLTGKVEVPLTEI